MIWDVLESPQWLLVYDIADPKRLRRTSVIAAKYGIRLQRSVYLLELKRSEPSVLITSIQQVINPQKDDVCLYHLPIGTRMGRQQQTRTPEGVVIANAGWAW